MWPGALGESRRQQEPGPTRSGRAALPLGAKLGGEPHINGSPGPRGCLLGACSMLPSHVVELQLCFFRLGIQLSLPRDGATLAAPHCH